MSTYAEPHESNFFRARSLLQAFHSFTALLARRRESHAAAVTRAHLEASFESWVADKVR